MATFKRTDEDVRVKPLEVHMLHSRKRSLPLTGTDVAGNPNKTLYCESEQLTIIKRHIKGMDKKERQAVVEALQEEGVI